MMLLPTILCRTPARVLLPSVIGASEWVQLKSQRKFCSLIKGWKGTRLCSRMLSPTGCGVGLFFPQSLGEGGVLSGLVQLCCSISRSQRPVQTPHASRCHVWHFWPEGPGSRSLHGAPYQQVKLAQAQRKRGNKRVQVYYPDSILISWEFSWALLMTIWKQTSK